MRTVVHVSLTPITQSVISRQGISGCTIAVMEATSGQVQAKGDVLDRETHFGRGALHRAGARVQDVGDVGKSSVGRFGAFDGVAEDLVDFSVEARLQACTSTSAIGSKVLLNGRRVVSGA